MDNDWKNELHKLICAIRHEKEAGKLLSELLTPAEHDDLAKRWQIVKLLMKNETQRNISKKLKLSIATVTRGAKELNYGDGTFQIFFKRLYSRKFSK